MSHSLEASRAWVDEGTALCRKAIGDLDETSVRMPSALVGWSRAHVVAHLAANADAVGNLVTWARTAVETPMYSSAQQRAEDIEAGSTRSLDDLREWFDASADRLAAAMDGLTADQWQAQVRTAQGRTVPASETPWMRAREVMVHAVDLATGITFADLPDDFLQALQADIRTKRGPAAVPEVSGLLAEVTAYLAGRPFSDVVTHDGHPAPALPPWL
ncbi:maleylpyruvate isomerase family mycothiol-dependent enzyme [Knoellia sp. CPCC 206450]|uniref:maleylpyruvate isomerase family mycothiol-dependent enzyme n=1 Tax=Knoellia tibetensis TaxID=3404798 RepID=UPI003B436836